MERFFIILVILNLFDHKVKNKEGFVSDNGTFMVNTGIFTRRSPKDRYFVKQDESQKYIALEDTNFPINAEIF